MKGVVLALLLTVTANADELPTFTCRGLNSHDFCCTSKNVTGAVKWQIYAHQEPDRAEAASACFVADSEWRVIEMRAPNGESEYVARALVRRDGDKIVFRQYRGATGVE